MDSLLWILDPYLFSKTTYPNLAVRVRRRHWRHHPQQPEGLRAVLKTGPETGFVERAPPKPPKCHTKCCRYTGIPENRKPEQEKKVFDGKIIKLKLCHPRIKKWWISKKKIVKVRKWRKNPIKTYFWEFILEIATILSKLLQLPRSKQNLTFN